MGMNSAIEWTHHTFNPWRGCSKVSPGCDNCYAERASKRNPKVLGIWGDDGQRVVAAEAYWKQPIKWDAAAKLAGERHRVFCASLADWLELRPELVMPRRALLDLIRTSPNLDFLLLTKRLENWRQALELSCTKPGDLTEWINQWLHGNAPENVWMGTSVENAQVLPRVTELMHVPARVRFLSVEPMIGPLKNINLSRIDWVICGGESGPDARPMHPDWARDLRDQCVTSKVAFFFKQWGEYEPVTPLYEGRDDSAENGRGELWSVDTRGRLYDDFDGQPNDLRTYQMERVGKKLAGRLLDGREWNEFPEVR
jgi:protein gp37